MSPVSATSQGEVALILDKQGRLPTFDLECGEFETDRGLEDCQAYLFDPATQELIQVSQSDQALPTEIHPIPQSDRLLSVKDGDLYLEQPQRGSAQKLINLSGQIRAPRVSPNGQWLALTHQEIEGGFEILSNPDRAEIKHWSLQVRAFDPPQAEDVVLSVPDAIAYQWTGSTLWALTLVGRTHDQLKRIAEAGNAQLALKRVECAETECRSHTQWQTDIPSESVSLYAGIPTKLAPQAFLALDADANRAAVVAMAVPPSEESIAPHRRRVARLLRIDLSQSEPEGEVVRRNAFHPTFDPEGRLVYWAPSGIAEASERRAPRRATCLTASGPTTADRLRCLVIGTAIYRRQGDGTEQRLTPTREPVHLLLSQTFWIDERQLGYVKFDTELEEGSDSNEATITATRLKSLNPDTQQITDLSRSVQAILAKHSGQ